MDLDNPHQQQVHQRYRRAHEHEFGHPTYDMNEAQRSTSGKAVAAFLLGLGGILVPVLIPSVLAVVFGHAARKDLRADPTKKGDGLAMAGIVLGWIGIVVIGLVILALMFAL